jgi:hypothetical protein
MPCVETEGLMLGGSRPILTALAWAGAAWMALLPGDARGQTGGETPASVPSVRFEIALGYGHEQVAPSDPDGIAAGFGLQLQWGQVLAGALLDGAGGSRRDSSFLGLMAGGVLSLAPWAQLELAGEVGRHAIGFESEYAGVPTHYAHLPCLGVRAAVMAFADAQRSPVLLWARRVGFGLRAGLRADLGRASLQVEGAPGTGLPQTSETIEVGGWGATVLLSTILEW